MVTPTGSYVPVSSKRSRISRLVLIKITCNSSNFVKTVARYELPAELLQLIESELQVPQENRSA